MAVRARSLSALAVLVVLAVSGCSPATAPTATQPSPSPSAPARPIPVSQPESAARVVIADEGLSVRAADGEEIVFFPYGTDPARAIGTMTRLFDGPPETTHTPGDHICEPETTTYKWDGLSIYIFGEPKDPTRFSAGADEAAEHSTMVVESLHGGRIGGSFSDLLAQIPDTLHDHWFHDGSRVDVLMDGVSPSELDAYSDDERPGVRVYALDDSITSIFAPVSFLSDC